jgi:hypothetical protein
MSDSDPSDKKSGAPSWQSDLKGTTPTEGDTEPQPPSRETVIEQAKKFLEEDEVRNAPADKKISFLESKGLSNEDIQSLMGVERHTDASAPPPSTVSYEAINVNQLLIASQNSSTSLQPRPTYSMPPPRATPPVITYPEFLTTPPHPSPLVTMSRLRTTLYLFGGLSALIYGTDNYLVTPMVASLTAARHSLAESASANLARLITKLESLVSVPLPEKKPPVDIDSDDDPSELFHRDIGIQTSAPPSPRPASPSANPIEHQAAGVKSLMQHVSDMSEESVLHGIMNENLSKDIADLRAYCEDLAYVPPSFGYGVGGYGAVQTGKEDEIARVKASIRGVKGVLLSTRSFPGVARGVR